MAFITDKEELKPGLIIFRRADVQHRNFYCRIQLPKADRYKTIALKTANSDAARDQAYAHDADIRLRLKHDVPVFNQPFAGVAKEYLVLQEQRATHGEISMDRPGKLKAVIEGPLHAYVGSMHICHIGQDTWSGYPAHRRATGEGRYRKGVISDSTIRFELSILGAVMNYAISKRYVPASSRCMHRPALTILRRDEFTPEEYSTLHAVGEAWVSKATKSSNAWYRTMAYNFIRIMCSTGMRPSEAKNLRWRDITRAYDRDGREVLVLSIQGNGKSRTVVAPMSVDDYLERIRAITKAKEPDDRVFTTAAGEPTKTLYKNMIDHLLTEATLRDGPSGIPRSTYSFRHTYATSRLRAGVGVYLLAVQMGTSVKMIEDYYGHVNIVRHADCVLKGMSQGD